MTTSRITWLSVLTIIEKLELNESEKNEVDKKNDKMSKSDGDDFLDSINAVIKAKVDGAFYITFYRLGISQYYSSFERVGLKCRSLVIWDKGNHTLSNSDYMSMYEPIFYGWVNSHKFYGGKNGMDIWRIPRTSKNELHPTMKPVDLCVKAIEDGSQINGIVLDFSIIDPYVFLGFKK